MNKLIRYKDLGNRINKYSTYIVWRGSIEDMINKWLDPIYYYAKEKSKFYTISDERDCGWYIKKDIILEMLKNNIPNTSNDEYKSKFNLILDELYDYIIHYKEPQHEK